MIPIGTDRATRRTPIVNTTLIGLNVLVAIIVGLSPQASAWAQTHAWLHPSASWMPVANRIVPIEPEVWQFITYQFLHDQQSITHLLFNMVFLWVFGAALEDRFGHFGYGCFYLSGGIVAGLAHCATSDAAVIGASGSVSAVTGMYLALFPQTKVRVIWLFILISVFEIPSLWFVSFSMARDLFYGLSGGGGVAYWAHLGGNAYGLVLGMILLWARLSPRDGYDLFSMIRHWRRRQHFRSVTGRGYDPWQGRRSHSKEARRSGSAARSSATHEQTDEDQPAELDPDEAQRLEHRQTISEALRADDLDTAAARYVEGIHRWDGFTLGAPQQLEVANHLYQSAQYDDAVKAYELLLAAYPTADPTGRIRLLTAVALVRHLDRPADAKPLLEKAIERMGDGADRALASELLEEVTSAT